IKWVGILDEEYPKILKECADAPIVLFYKGDLSVLKNKNLAVVGTRKMSDYGKEMVKELIEHLQPYNPTIVSGMAYGVDIAAYREARKCSWQLGGVMGTSVTKVCPSMPKQAYKDLL